MRSVNLLLLFSIIPLVVFAYQSAEASGPGTIYIYEPDGGDCVLPIGIWDSDTSTCTLQQDIQMMTINMHDSGITLDGNGKSLIGAGDNYCNYGWYFGIDGDGESNFTIKDITVSGYYNGLDMEDGGGNTITDSKFNNNCHDGINLSGSDDNTFTNVESNFNGDDGLDLDDGSDSNSFSDSKFNNNDDSGIQLQDDGTDLNTFNNNESSDNGDEGVELKHADDNIFTSNTVLRNGDSGFDIEDDSDDNTFSCNTVKGNGVAGGDQRGTGFEMQEDSNRNEAFNNLVEGNLIGIGLYEGSKDNNIHDNNIISNLQQVEDDTDENNILSPNYWGGNIPPEDQSPLQSAVDLSECGIEEPEPEGILYSISKDDNLLRTIDISDGSTTNEVAISFSEAEISGGTGLAFDSTTGTLWGILKIQEQKERELVTINPSTGVATSIGNLGDRFAGIAFNSEGVLFGITGDGASVSETLYTIDKSDASLNLICELGRGNDGEAIAIDDSDVLYHASGLGRPNISEIFEKITNPSVCSEPQLIPLSGYDYAELTAMTFWSGEGFLAADLNFDFVSISQEGEVVFIGNMDHQSKGLAVLDPNSGGKTSNGGSNQWDTRPTFGVSHETRQGLIVENGFSFNGDYFTVTDNHHTDFAEQSVEIGTMNSFTATVYADKSLKVQEFLFGIPNVGESHLAELGIEVWYDRDGAIEDIVVDQDTAVIDEGTISVSHEKTKCLSTDSEPLCDTTTVSMTFLEPLADKVMAVKAIDYALRDQRTYLNDGFDISGDSLNPMLTQMIPSNVKNQGLLEVTQLVKYSPYWQSADGRMFEMNSFGSFKEINQSFERFQDTGNAFTRLHSGFGGILDYEQNRATQVFDSSKLISDLPDSFGYHFEMTERLNDQLLNEMLEQQEIAKKILEEMDKQTRHN
jgi:parallel beta-helix repeat protein